MAIRAAQVETQAAVKALAADMRDGTARVVLADEGVSVWVMAGGKLVEYPVVESIDVRTPTPGGP